MDVDNSLRVRLGTLTTTLKAELDKNVGSSDTGKARECLCTLAGHFRTAHDALTATASASKSILTTLESIKTLDSETVPAPPSLEACGWKGNYGRMVSKDAAERRRAEAESKHRHLLEEHRQRAEELSRKWYESAVIAIGKAPLEDARSAIERVERIVSQGPTLARCDLTSAALPPVWR